MQNGVASVIMVHKETFWGPFARRDAAVQFTRSLIRLTNDFLHGERLTRGRGSDVQE